VETINEGDYRKTTSLVLLRKGRCVSGAAQGACPGFCNCAHGPGAGSDPGSAELVVFVAATNHAPFHGAFPAAQCSEIVRLAKAQS
jgi:hypothetical protein